VSSNAAGKSTMNGGVNGKILYGWRFMKSSINVHVINKITDYIGAIVEVI